MAENIENETDIDAPVEIADKPREPSAYERKLRQENANYRLRAKEALAASEAAVAKANEDAAARVADATKAAEQRIIRAELKAAALAAGMTDLDCLKLLDLTKVKLLENGEVEGADALMADAKKAKPHFFGAAASTSSTQTAPRNAPAAEKAVKDMTPAEYRAMRAKLSAL